MSTPWAIVIGLVIAGGIIAASILVTNHWETTGINNLFAYRMNRWTGATSVCLAVNLAPGAKVDCGDRPIVPPIKNTDDPADWVPYRPPAKN